MITLKQIQQVLGKRSLTMADVAAMCNRGTEEPALKTAPNRQPKSMFFSTSEYDPFDRSHVLDNPDNTPLRLSERSPRSWEHTPPHYMEIGHHPGGLVWVWGGDRLHVKEQKVKKNQRYQLHQELFRLGRKKQDTDDVARNLQDRYKGRYDPITHAASISVPTQHKYRSIPGTLLAQIDKLWPGASIVPYFSAEAAFAAKPQVLQYTEVGHKVGEPIWLFHNGRLDVRAAKAYDGLGDFGEHNSTWDGEVHPDLIEVSPRGHYDAKRNIVSAVRLGHQSPMLSRHIERLLKQRWPEATIVHFNTESTGDFTVTPITSLAALAQRLEATRIEEEARRQAVFAAEGMSDEERQRDLDEEAKLRKHHSIVSSQLAAAKKAFRTKYVKPPKGKVISDADIDRLTEAQARVFKKTGRMPKGWESDEDQFASVQIKGKRFTKRKYSSKNIARRTVGRTHPQFAAAHEVVVGNIGTVYSGDDEAQARHHFHKYRRQARQLKGRAAQEPVTWLHKGEIKQEAPVKSNRVE